MENIIILEGIEDYWLRSRWKIYGVIETTAASVDKWMDQNWTTSILSISSLV
jgi:hypothetical protein